MINHPSLNNLRNDNKQSMRLPAMAEFLILLINILRKGFINHPVLGFSLLLRNDLSFSLTDGVSNHSLFSISLNFCLVRGDYRGR
jgi:hypothetical protein